MCISTTTMIMLIRSFLGSFMIPIYKWSLFLGVEASTLTVLIGRFHCILIDTKARVLSRSYSMMSTRRYFWEAPKSRRKMKNRKRQCHWRLLVKDSLSFQDSHNREELKLYPKFIKLISWLWMQYRNSQPTKTKINNGLDIKSISVWVSTGQIYQQLWFIKETMRIQFSL